MNNKKIIILGPELGNFGGVSNYWRAINPFLPSSIKYLGFKTTIDQNRFSVLLNIFNITSFLFKNNFDTIMINISIDYVSITRALIFSTFSSAKRKIIFIRGWKWKSQRTKLLNYLFKILLNNIDEIVVLSSEFKKDLENQNNFKKNILVETTKYEYSKKSEQSTFNKKNLVFCSRLEKSKGILKALKVFENLKLSELGYSFEIIGSGSLSSKVKSLSNSMKSVIFHGQLNYKDVENVLIKSGALIFPSSHFEGMPNSVVEAMALKNIIIGFNVAGVKDYLNDSQLPFIDNNNHTISKLSYMFETYISTPEKDLEKLANKNKSIVEHNMRHDIVAKRIVKFLNL